jgi:hypothetical protein
VRIHPALEDRAGNRFDRLFDSEGLEPSGTAGAGPPEAIRLPFDAPGPPS